MGGQAAEHPSATRSTAPSQAPADDAGWSEAEQIIARCAFDRAQQRAIASLVQTVQAHARTLDSVESVWTLHDFLSIQRHAIEGRFDFRLSGLLFVFASLVRDELLTLEELDGLDAVKLAKISAMSRI
ncbi:hypothetical protein [Cyanobium sp. CH-040]|uniref:hypothetical protein n=1 Tax=Cyanobium sp. CH-040 TaxID=2823708 RepID=UPI0020CED482|nr:hypothetical protein [Cyanobium sp. CH-040]MCP9927506.1 hypothetical protein [Cyanobium sp. CH-040]